MKKLVIALSMVIFIGCSPMLFKSEWTKEIAPAIFVTRFETSKGFFDIEVTRKLSPKAADRFFQLVNHQYFDNSLFYRVNPGFVAQFGSKNKASYEKWNAINVPDEKVIQGNERGTLSFARGGKQTRTTDLFINLGDNSRLDTLNYNGVKGFPTFGKVVQGMPVVDSLYSGYSDTAMNSLNLMYSNSNQFLKKYPKLDTIKRVFLLKK